MSVIWLQSAQLKFDEATHLSKRRFDDWRPMLDAVLEQIFQKQQIIVMDRLSGYRAFSGLSILLVEVQPLPNAGATRFFAPNSYIVKIGFDEKCDELALELKAWRDNCPNDFRSDGVFVSLDEYKNGSRVEALIYGDANRSMGRYKTMSLEDAIMQSCRFGIPTVESLNTTLKILYERAGQYFYSYSNLFCAKDWLHKPTIQPQKYLDRYDLSLPRSQKESARQDPARRRLRSEIDGLLVKNDDDYTDPVDMMRGMLNAQIGPDLLLGKAHGDMHGLNVRVAISDDNVTSCAVFDYERFHSENAIAWDFVTLEVESVSRVLVKLKSQLIPTFAKICLRFFTELRDRSLDHVNGAKERSQKMECVELERLAKLILNIRILAEKELTRNRYRGFEWFEEYMAVLSIYSIRASLYDNYTVHNATVALVAGGVAARWLMRKQPAEVELSYRKRFAEAKDLCRAKEEENMMLGRDKLCQLADQNEYPHILQIQEELALANIKLRDFVEAEKILHAIADVYDHTTAETKSLLGSLWKRRATQSNPYDVTALREALKWYQRAYEQDEEYYPLINVASLHLILNENSKSRNVAEMVIQNIDSAVRPDFWASATRGEALLICGKPVDEIVEQYQRTIHHAECKAQDRKSMASQIKNLLPYLTEQYRTYFSDVTLQKLFQLEPELKS